LWETTYNSCKKMNIPDVADTRPVQDFLSAVHDMAPGFMGYWRAKIQVLEHKKAIPDIYEIIEYFRNSVRTANAEKSGVTHGAFSSTFQGQKLDGKTSDGKEEKSTKPCLCGLPHKFKTCWYLMESLRPATWKPNKNIQQQIEEKLEKSAKLHEI